MQGGTLTRRGTEPYHPLLPPAPFDNHYDRGCDSAFYLAASIPDTQKEAYATNQIQITSKPPTCLLEKSENLHRETKPRLESKLEYDFLDSAIPSLGDLVLSLEVVLRETKKKPAFLHFRQALLTGHLRHFAPKELGCSTLIDQAVNGLNLGTRHTVVNRDGRVTED